jgi:arsenate reductase
MMKRVLFLCTGNSARSQMAEGLLRALGGGQYEVFSAGTAPKGVNPLAVRAMAEIGVDVSGQTSKHLQQYLNDPFDYVITVCDRANESCPVFLGGRVRLHWGFDDPHDLADFRRMRDEIAERLREWLQQEGG